MEIAAKFYDGVSSKEHIVTVRFSKEGRFIIEEFGIDLPVEVLEISPRLGNTPRVINLPGKERCKIEDNEKLDKILEGLNINRSGIHKLERSWKAALASVALIAAVVVFMLTAGADYTADFLAKMVPRGTLDYASKNALEQLDKTVLHKSNLNKQKKVKILKMFSRLTGGDKRYKLHFRSSPQIGANAFALPSGDIILLDELVMLDKDKQLRGILGVLAHEKGHVVYRHGLRSIIKGAIASSIITYITGDISILVSSVPTLLITSGYSRKFESQADRYAKKELNRMHISSKPLAKLFEKLDAFYGKRNKESNISRYMGWISTHPPTKERIKFFMKD